MHLASSPFGGALYKPLPILWPIAPVELFHLFMWIYLRIRLGIVGKELPPLSCPYPCEEKEPFSVTVNRLLSKKKSRRDFSSLRVLS